jgi:phage terminase large subunit-like protein
MAWLPAQLAFLRHNSKVPALYRAGNRQGKTTVGAAELIFRARGKHPFKAVKAAPVRLACVTMTKSQGVAIQQVFWDLLDHAEVESDVVFTVQNGFRGHNPTIRFRNGSTIKFVTNNQGASALAGSEYDFILLDEPPAQDVYDEALKRVLNTGGSVALTLTPINGPPLPWLRELCEAGAVTDYWAKLTPESQISPLTGKPRLTKDGVPWDAEFIKKIWETTNPIDGPVRIDGEWESRVTGQFFDCFDKAMHVSPAVPDDDLVLALGLDWAAADREAGLCAVLSGWRRDKAKDQTVYVLGEVVMSGTTPMIDFAREVLRMIRDLRVEYKDLDVVYGDNPIRGARNLSSNSEFSKAVAQELGLQQRALRPGVRNVKEGVGASGRRKRTKDIRCRWAYGELGSNRVRVSPRCPKLVEALLGWDYSDTSPHKDVLDAWLYGLRDRWAAR